MLLLPICFVSTENQHILYCCVKFSWPSACRGNFLDYSSVTCSEKQAISMRCCNSSLQSKLFVMFLGNISPCFHYWNARSWVSLHRWVSLIPLASHQRIRRGGCGGASWWATAWSQESAWRHILWDRQSAISYSLFWTSNSSSQIWCEDSSYDFYNAMISASDGLAGSTPGQKGG